MSLCAGSSEGGSHPAELLPPWNAERRLPAPLPSAAVLSHQSIKKKKKTLLQSSTILAPCPHNQERCNHQLLYQTAESEHHREPGTSTNPREFQLFDSRQFLMLSSHQKLSSWFIKIPGGSCGNSTQLLGWFVRDSRKF